MNYDLLMPIPAAHRPKRAIIYTRISLDPTGEGAGVARQEEAARQLAASRGWQVVAVHSDNSISAYSGKVRPGFERAMQAAANGECDIIIAYAIDRLTRSIRDLLRLIDDVTEHGVGVVTATGDIDLTTAHGKMLATILAAVAAAEVEQKAARQRSANEQKARAGGRTKGIRPFGFEDDGVTLRPSEVLAIQNAATDLLSGKPLGAIAREWNGAGFRPSQKKILEDGTRAERMFTQGGVRYILRSPRYIGKRVYLGEVVGDAVWDPILEEGQFYAVQAHLSNPDRLSGPGYKRHGFHTHTSLLASLASCGKCGGTVRTNRATKGTRQPLYSCREHSCFAMVRDFPDELITAEVLVYISQPEAPFLVADDGSDVLDLAAMRSELDLLHDRKRQIGAAIGSGAMDLEVGLEAQRTVQEAVAEAERKIAQAGKGTVLEGLTDASTPEVWWKGLTLARQREVVADLMTIRLHPHPLGKTGRGFLPEQVEVVSRR